MGCHFCSTMDIYIYILCCIRHLVCNIVGINYNLDTELRCMKCFGCSAVHLEPYMLSAVSHKPSTTVLLDFYKMLCVSL